MRALVIWSNAVSGLFLAMMLLCGLWLKANHGKMPVDPGSIAFHAKLGVASVLIGLVAATLTLIYVART